MHNAIIAIVKRNLPLAVIVIVLVVGATVYFTAHYLSFQSSKTESEPVAACPVHGQQHVVKIQANKLRPQHTQGRLCDTLTITNEDDVIRLVAFGPHEHHTPYDGVTEKILEQHQSLTIVLNQAGTYGFHDHFHDEVTGSFTVTN